MTIREELEKAAKAKFTNAARNSDQEQINLIRFVEAVDAILTTDQFYKLSEESQKWMNDAILAIEDDVTVQYFSDNDVDKKEFEIKPISKLKGIKPVSAKKNRQQKVVTEPIKTETAAILREEVKEVQYLTRNRKVQLIPELKQEAKQRLKDMGVNKSTASARTRVMELAIQDLNLSARAIMGTLTDEKKTKIPTLVSIEKRMVIAREVFKYLLDNDMIKWA